MIDALLRHPEAHIEASVVFFDIILIFFSVRQTRKNTMEARTFRRLLIYSTIMVISEVSQGWMEELPDTLLSFYIINITNMIAYLSIMLTGFGTITYLSFVFGKKMKGWFVVMRNILIGVYIFFLILNLFNGCLSLYHYDTGVYVHGPLFVPIGNGLPMIGFFSALITFIKNLSRLSQRTRKTMIMAVGVMAVGMLIQPLFSSYITMTGLLASVSIFILYLSVETEDYTQLMAMTEGLEHAREEAWQANEAKSTFLANMSHEIRTPLNAFMGLNEMILKESHDFATIDHARDMRQAGDALLTIVNQVLDISKIESGNIELSEAEYHLSDILRDVEIIIEARAKDRGLTYIAEVDGGLPDLMVGDAVRIRQILVNVLNNSVKYTMHGVVVLCVRGEKKSDDKVDLLVQITDTGIGIRAEDIDTLFDTYKRVNEGETKGIEGTGIGLTIVKSFVEKMGGDISVDSHYGLGTMTFMRIPQTYRRGDTLRDVSNRSIETRMDESIGAYDASDYTVLVVDDNEMNIKVAEGFLKDTGIKVTTARGGREALAILKIKKFDLILLDAFMPVVDGPTVFKTIREDEKGKNHDTPCIVLTADALSGSEQKYLDLGFDAYLAKPIEGDKLKETIRQFLQLDKKPMREFVAKWSEKASVLEAACEAHDFKQYIMTIHSIKTGLREMKADEAAELANTLETAAKAAMKGQDDGVGEDIVVSRTPEMLKLYEETKNLTEEKLNV